MLTPFLWTRQIPASRATGSLAEIYLGSRWGVPLHVIHSFSLATHFYKSLILHYQKCSPLCHVTVQIDRQSGYSSSVDCGNVILWLGPLFPTISPTSKSPQARQSLCLTPLRHGVTVPVMATRWKRGLFIPAFLCCSAEFHFSCNNILLQILKRSLVHAN